MKNQKEINKSVIENKINNHKNELDMLGKILKVQLKIIEAPGAKENKKIKARQDFMNILFNIELVNYEIERLEIVLNDIDKVHNRYSILTVLKANDFTNEQIAEILEVDKRTIERYLKEMKEA